MRHQGAHTNRKKSTSLRARGNLARTNRNCTGLRNGYGIDFVLNIFYWIL